MALPYSGPGAEAAIIADGEREALAIAQASQWAHGRVIAAETVEAAVVAADDTSSVAESSRAGWGGDW